MHQPDAVAHPPPETHYRQANGRYTAYSSWPEEQTAPQGGAAFDFRWRKAPFVPWGMSPHENLYPLKIESLYLRSPYFRRITDDKAEQLQGDGLQFTGDGAALAQAWLADTGFTEETLEALAFDLALYNGCALQVIWNRGLTQVVGLHHTKLANLRAGKPGSNSGAPEAYYYSADWQVVNTLGQLRSKRYNEYAPVALPVYAPGKPANTQVLYGRMYSPVTDYYPLPDAESVFEELSLGTDVVGFQRRYVENGMVSSAIVYVPFAPEQTAPGEDLSEHDRTQLDRKRRQIMEDLTGNLKAGQLSIIWFNPYLTDKDGQPTGVPRIERPVEEKNDEKFIEIQRESRQAFLTGLGVVSGELYGIPKPGGFSSQAEMLLTAHELTYTKLIRPKQEVVLRMLKRLLRDAGYPGVELHVKARQPVAQRLTPEMVAAGIFSADEFRAAYGYGPRAASTSTAVSS